jgi:FtsZ-binding cell division protein ZapB
MQDQENEGLKAQLKILQARIEGLQKLNEGLEDESQLAYEKANELKGQNKLLKRQAGKAERSANQALEELGVLTIELERTEGELKSVKSQLKLAQAEFQGEGLRGIIHAPGVSDDNEVREENERLKFSRNELLAELQLLTREIMGLTANRNNLLEQFKKVELFSRNLKQENNDLKQENTGLQGQLQAGGIKAGANTINLKEEMQTPGGAVNYSDMEIPTRDRPPGNQTDQQDKKRLPWYKRLWQWIKSLFSKNTNNSGVSLAGVNVSTLDSHAKRSDGFHIVEQGTVSAVGVDQKNETVTESMKPGGRN